MAESCKNVKKYTFLAKIWDLEIKSKKIKKFFHILKGQVHFFHFLILFNSVRKTSKMAKTGLKLLNSAQKRSKFPIFVGRRPTTDLFHVLACGHGHCPASGSTGVGRRPTPEPPARARIYWCVAPINSSMLYLNLLIVKIEQINIFLPITSF